MFDAGPYLLLGGDYTLRVLGEGADVGTFAFELVATEDPAAVSVAIGELVTGELVAPTQVVEYTVEAEGGERVFVDFTDASAYYENNWRLLDPFGNVLLDWTTALFDAGAYTLSKGTYRLQIRSEGASIGTWSFVIRPIADTSGAATLENPIAGALATPGQQDVWTFAAPPNTAVYLDVTATSNAYGLNYILIDSAGREVIARTTSLVDRGPYRLMGGDYSLRVLGEGSEVGSYELIFRTVTDSSATTSLDTLTTGEISIPGARHHYTFSADAGRLVTLTSGTSSNYYGLNWILTDSAGRKLVSRTTSLSTLGPLALMGGQYTLTVVGEGAAVGTYGFTLNDGGMQTFDGGGIPISVGDVVDDAIAVAGEVDLWEFTLSEKTHVFLDLLSGQDKLYWNLKDTVGQPVFSDLEAHTRAPVTGGPIPCCREPTPSPCTTAQTRRPPTASPWWRHRRWRRPSSWKRSSHPPSPRRAASTPTGSPWRSRPGSSSICRTAGRSSTGR